jgi:hypothetical protein
MPYIDATNPQWYINSGLGWAWWKLLDAIFTRITVNGKDADLSSVLGGGIEPYLEAAAELGLTQDDIVVGIASLQAPDSELRRVLADVLRPDFATPQAALTHLKERLAELDPLNARLLLALVAGASKASGG